jgi:hypothetical protein
MTNDASPATKADVTMLMDSIGNLYVASERWKEELKEHFAVAVEHIRHELLAAKREKIELLDDRTKRHEKRIERLEIHARI